MGISQKLAWNLKLTQAQIWLWAQEAAGSMGLSGNKALGSRVSSALPGRLDNATERAPRGTLRTGPKGPHRAGGQERHSSRAFSLKAAVECWCSWADIIFKEMFLDTHHAVQSWWKLPNSASTGLCLSFVGYSKPCSFVYKSTQQTRSRATSWVVLVPFGTSGLHPLFSLTRSRTGTVLRARAGDKTLGLWYFMFSLRTWGFDGLVLWRRNAN